VIIAITCLIAIAVIAFVLGVRPKDLPPPEPESPFQHFDERKAAIYENLRDLQFEYRMGKLSDADYQTTKKDLQKELAQVLAEVDKLKISLNGTAPRTAPKPAPKKEAPANVCEACGATFEKALKFCGECGKPMKVAK
jgi:rRNA maturation endonuclease Nob1